jgi:hypothetical protein
VLGSRGGFCDCEILYNAASSRRKIARFGQVPTPFAPQPARHLLQARSLCLNTAAPTWLIVPFKIMPKSANLL